MKLNNKGFAISSIMYIILVLAIILIALILAIFSSRKLILDKQRNDALHEIYQTRYKNGDVVYFDVEKGIGCSEEDYDETNSNTGYNGFNNKSVYSDETITEKLETQNSCLKFYAFNDDGGDSVNLLLDHNITSYVEWGVSSNATGPKEVMTKLASDTSSWQGTQTPSNYTVTQTIGGNYTIDYSNYKARLITAEEIARITGNTTFDVATTNYEGWFYLDTNTSTESTTCYYNRVTETGDTSGCKYGWLYDRTGTSCTTYGCLNNSTEATNGYWTGTSVAGDTYYVWGVDNYSELYISDYAIMTYGVRPVIEVLREKLL